MNICINQMVSLLIVAYNTQSYTKLPNRKMGFFGSICITMEGEYV
jgi:hypothetical protein